MDPIPRQAAGAREALENPESYVGAGGAPPDRECDVVMKGGITSGVVYPLAVCELARKFRLRNVGGTSAGAIAAALSAAAEHGRMAPDGGFARLARLPDWIGAEGRLLSLFRPDRRTRSLFRIALAGLKRHRGWLGSSRRALSVLLAASRAAVFSWWFWLPLLGAVPGLLFLAAALGVPGASAPGSALGWVELGAAVLVLVVGWALGVVWAVLRLAARRLPENHYGLVRGFSHEEDAGPRLTDWLADEIDRTAGKSGRNPLTFGELWAGPAGEETGGNRSVNLEMLTTDLTTGGPVRLPHELGRSSFFDRKEMRSFFPDRVVDWMENHPPPAPTTSSARERWEELVARVSRAGLAPLPPPEHLPVVVAVRLSLSFPVLFSAIPFYSFDWTLPSPKPERKWFSDGGIASNFPVHFFGSLLPGRPTFGLNLRPFHPRYPKSESELENVFVPRSNVSGTAAWWTRWEAFPGSVVSSASWVRSSALCRTGSTTTSSSFPHSGPG